MPGTACWNFVLVDALRMALLCRNMCEFDTCHELYFMVCILLRFIECVRRLIQ